MGVERGRTNLKSPEKAGRMPGKFEPVETVTLCLDTDSLLDINGVWSSRFNNTFEVWC